jgi:hypothetical protein
MPFSVGESFIARFQKSSHDEQEAIKRSGDSIDFGTALYVRLKGCTDYLKALAEEDRQRGGPALAYRYATHASNAGRANDYDRGRESRSVESIGE